MPQAITTIRLALPYHLGSVNCYLIETDWGHVLVLNATIGDAAAANASVALLKSLKVEAVYPGHGKPFPLDPPDHRGHHLGWRFDPEQAAGNVKAAAPPAETSGAREAEDIDMPGTFNTAGSHAHVCIFTER